MTLAAPVESREKIALVWAARRERVIAVRVQYQVADDRGCKVYLMESIKELQ